LPTICIPPPFRGASDGAIEIRVDGSTVRGCLEAAIGLHPALGELLFDAHGKPQRFVKFFRGEDPIDAAALDKPVAEGDEIHVVAAIGGGAAAAPRPTSRLC
jgi:hypothetical protein